MTKKRLAAIALALAMVVPMFSACAKTPAASSSATSSSTSSSTGTSYKDHLDISIAYWSVGASVDASKPDLIRDQVYKKFNMTIVPDNITWDDYKTKINTWAAAGNLPDVFADDAITESNFSKWCTEGVVQAIPTDLSAYPNIQKYLSQADVQNYKYPLGAADAKYYCIPRPTYSTMDMWANDNAVMVRKDWMEKVGITTMPTNMDEFITLMKAFVQKDPDGDGKNDTIGLTCYDAGWLSYLMNNYEPAVQTWKLVDGQWVAGLSTDDALLGVEALKKLYDAGGLDQDFATLKSGDGLAKFTSGKAGAYAHSGYPTTLVSVQQAMQKVYPDKKFADTVTLMLPWKSPDGNYYRTIASTPWSETYFNAKDSAEKVQRVLAFMDWGLSTDGFNLMRYGIKDVDYTQSGDTITPIISKDAKGNPITLNTKYPFCGLGSFFSWEQDFSYKNPSTDPSILKLANDTLNWEIKNCKGTPTNLALAFINYPAKSKINWNLKDALTKAILSKDAVATWKQIVADYNKNGGTEAQTEINAQAKALNITGVTEP